MNELMFRTGLVYHSIDTSSKGNLCSIEDKCCAGALSHDLRWMEVLKISEPLGGRKVECGCYQ